MRLSRSQWVRALLVLAANVVFLGLLVAIFVLGLMKYLAVSGTAHPETIEYHITTYLPYFVAVVVVGSLWSYFQSWSGQDEILEPFQEENEVDE